jgi:predicted regulator of Ras-like GTPase activity (Roadblock/LC7/MglB family)
VTGKNYQDGGNAPLSFVEILQEMNSEGGFEWSVLATSEGLPVACVPDDSDSELAGAMVALLQKVGQDTQGNLGMAPVDEVTIRTEDRTHLVCRRIGAGDDCLSLCAVVPANCRYRRATNKAIKRIRIVLDG